MELYRGCVFWVSLSWRLGGFKNGPGKIQDMRNPVFFLDQWPVPVARGGGTSCGHKSKPEMPNFGKVCYYVSFKKKTWNTDEFVVSSSGFRVLHQFQLSIQFNATTEVCESKVFKDLGSFDVLEYWQGTISHNGDLRLIFRVKYWSLYLLE